ncbi:MAG: DUF3127 domain-containing protein [Cytophagales bacterium]|nr:DUF3127 domain-containing protein [Bernardetiaceae bacterium]MDW8210176.1 DUF3127 domain-containing protein [Cytophagales bacterium]
MSYEVKGKLVVVYQPQQLTDKFRKREFVIEIPAGTYSEFIKFQLTQEKCSLIDDFALGQEIKVYFTLRGRPYTKDGTTTYFTNLEAWRIEAVAPANPISSPAAPQATPPISLTESSEDELPF